MDDDVDGMDDDMDDITSVVGSSFVYPSYESVKAKEMTVIPTQLIFNYKCDSNDSHKCVFPMTALSESAELKSVGIRETAEVVVKTIDAHQHLFTARQCGGYILKAAGTSLILIRNDSMVPSDETRFGFADLTDIRRRLIHQREMSKLKTQTERNSSYARWSSTIGSAIGGGGVAATVVLVVLKGLKKI
jgi:hypothetical protein